MIQPPWVTTNAIRRPSCDQAGARWPPVGKPTCVSAAAPEPSRLTVHNVDCPEKPPTSEVKTREPLSGDQAGSDPNSLICCAVPPVAGMIQTPPRLREWNAIHWPSGDQAGCMLCPPSLVSGTSEPAEV